MMIVLKLAAFWTAVFLLITALDLAMPRARHLRIFLEAVYAALLAWLMFGCSAQREPAPHPRELVFLADASADVQLDASDADASTDASADVQLDASAADASTDASADVQLDASDASDADVQLDASDASAADAQLASCGNDGLPASVCAQAQCASACRWCGAGVCGVVCCADPRYVGGEPLCSCDL